MGDDFLEAEVAELGSAQTATAFWDVDTPATLARLEGNPDDPLNSFLPNYDLVLCYGGGASVCRRFRALGARRCEMIYNALDPDSHHPVERDDRFSGDLGFLGNCVCTRGAAQQRL